MATSTPPVPASASALVTAYRLDGRGGGEQLDDDALRRAWDSDNAPLWMHLDFRQGDVTDYLEAVAGLEEAVVEALLEADTRPRVARFGRGVVTTLRGINFNPGAAPDDLISLRVWVTPKRLITLRRRSLHAVNVVREQINAGEGAISIPDLLAWLVETLVDQVGDVTHQLEERMAELEDTQLSDDDSLNADDLTRIRRPLITLRRFMGPQRDCLAQLAQGPLWLDEESKVSIRESANQLSRYVEDFNAMQERALIIQEQLWSQHNEQLNQRMYMLAIITTVFLPLSFLTGLLGVNVGGIPGANSPYGFAVFILLTLVLGVGVMALLKRKRWW
ncbi:MULTISPECIES: zinc transporter ZntB [Modicisalibacter]|uniref:zinc transporter ZntB n=1 Tax=Modicisalibacter TaxID=574347 RepID=UPI00100A53C7|nr:MULTISPECIES: zinc transporter ZntB [Halomonadaceae]MBZ9557643.1 zinc transporter ZntB [Modicisalibacter sp. R2A 31.J]MBZ9573693.1 zinc transporter ZntB [Modicisalibacter sp. MOD 31.J]